MPREWSVLRGGARQGSMPCEPARWGAGCKESFSGENAERAKRPRAGKPIRFFVELDSDVEPLAWKNLAASLGVSHQGASGGMKLIFFGRFETHGFFGGFSSAASLKKVLLQRVDFLPS